MSRSQHIRFNLHDTEHAVRTADITPETTLLQYLREKEHLTGTKLMCLEGGCGACIVAVTAKHPLTKRTVTFSINSCLVSIYSCEGWTIHTVEGIGNQIKGFHPVQKTLAAFNGTQCGFCSPGMVMNMYPLYESNNLTMQEVEDSFGSNMCRCTGYRPILTAFKSMAKDASEDVLGEYPDIEDFQECPKSEENCRNKCSSICKRRIAPINYFESKESRWYKVYSINEIFDVLQNNPDSSYMLVGGNTARGVYHLKKYPDVYIDITSVTNLINYSESSDTLTVGGAVTLTEVISLFRRVANKSKNFSYLKKLAHHVTLVAHVPVRNIGTIAGNLSIKHEHPEFPSDMFLILEAVGAKLTIVDDSRQEQEYNLIDYRSLDMNRKVIKNIKLPALDDSYKYTSYKIMPRAQNAHAMVNSGFLLQFDDDNKVVSARIVYGGIKPSFVHAKSTEKYLVGKKLFENNTIQGALKQLDDEVQPNVDLPNPSPKFRKGLALSLFYKYVLSIAPSNLISPEHKSGGTMISRPISTGVQDYQSNKSLYPLTEPIPKIEALLQTSGELEYITDMPYLPGQLHASFVKSNAEACSIITSIDPSEALKLPGVVAFFDKNDIPGTNSFMPINPDVPIGYYPITRNHFLKEELFCSGEISYYFQPLGMIVAETPELAEKAADLVKVTYAPGTEKPLFTVRDILNAHATNRISNEANLKATKRGIDIKHVVKGTYDTSWQYHYHMETQIAFVNPLEDVLQVHTSTQWLDIVQNAISSLLKLPMNKIDIRVKRIGGAFGAKITRNCLIACGAALAAYKLKKPVRLRMTFETNMDVVGKRYPTSANYEVGLNDKGEIQYLETAFFMDYGSPGNDAFIIDGFSVFYDSYDHKTWTVSGNSTTTNNHGASFARAPAHCNIYAIIESILEHCSMELDMSPVELRLANMKSPTLKKLVKYVDQLRSWSDYEDRLKQVKKFNKENRWMKKGMSLLPMTYAMVYLPGMFHVHVAIFAGDGTVAVTHGGVEIGQGINTKVAQVCAYALKIPLESVSIKATNVESSPNNFTTGGSITSECCCYATLRACETLVKRMEPVKAKMLNPTWLELVRACYAVLINLEASHMFTRLDPAKGYNAHGVCATEVQVDLLTGTHQVLRVDILEDVGNSLSPVIDIGQVEGAFIMGLGYWTTEETVFDDKGKILTDRTWNYKIPGAKDIPIDFRILFPKNNPNSLGVLHSKGTGEPPLLLAFTIPLAIRHALVSARKAADPHANKWYPIDGPSSVENTFLNSLNDYSQYTL